MIPDRISELEIANRSVLKWNTKKKSLKNKKIEREHNIPELWESFQMYKYV